MKIKRLRCELWLLLINATVVLLAAGCATQNMSSFNQDYGQKYPSSPQYAVENIDDTHFKVTVTQGSPLPGEERVIYMKQAASAVAETEAKRRGWQNWDLEYIQQRDQGWMHIIIGEVTRKNAVQMAPAQPGNKP